MECRECMGLGYKEYQSGLIRLRCTRCNGEGNIDELSIGTRQFNKDTGKPIKRKRKIRKVNIDKNA